jgi:micrococcal nuclease
MFRSATASHPLNLPAAMLLALTLAASTPRIAPVDKPAMPTPPPLVPASASPVRQLVPAELIRVIDGDTIEVRALIWLDQFVTTRVRLRDIDAPERSARCPAEARIAEESAAALARMLVSGRLFLAEVGRDKYGGRVLARVITASGGDAGEALRMAGLARTYAGKRRDGWCG